MKLSDLRKKYRYHVSKVHTKDGCYYSTEFKKDLMKCIDSGKTTQAEVARAFGIDPAIISDWHRGYLPLENKFNTKVG
jgi:hypothetical protein